MSSLLLDLLSSHAAAAHHGCQDCYVHFTNHKHHTVKRTVHPCPFFFPPLWLCKSKQLSPYCPYSRPHGRRFFLLGVVTRRQRRPGRGGRTTPWRRGWGRGWRGRSRWDTSSTTTGLSEREERGVFRLTFARQRWNLPHPSCQQRFLSILRFHNQSASF